MPMKRYHKLSALIRDAAAGAAKVDQSRYFPHYKYWHRPNPLGGCWICFAGTVLAGQIPDSFKLSQPLDLTQPFFNGAFSQQDVQQLSALDAVRRGCLHQAWVYLHVRPSEVDPAALQALEELEHKIDREPDVWIPCSEFSNWTDFDEFLVGMGSLATALEKIGM